MKSWTVPLSVGAAAPVPGLIAVRVNVDPLLLMLRTTILPAPVVKSGMIAAYGADDCGFGIVIEPLTSCTRANVQPTSDELAVSGSDGGKPQLYSEPIVVTTAFPPGSAPPEEAVGDGDGVGVLAPLAVGVGDGCPGQRLC